MVRTFDAGKLPSGEPFVIMERLEGDDLEARVRERGSLPSVPRKGHPNDPLVTCSPRYASPEQLGARADVDGRADVWALGAVLYELVTGRRAFEAATLPDMLQAIRRAPEAMKTLRADVPAGLEAIVRRCLARDREMRFDSALQLRDALVALRLNEVAEASWRAPATVRVKPVFIPPPASAPPSNQPRDPLTPLLVFLSSRVFLAMLAPISAIVSMTLVSLLLSK